MYIEADICFIKLENAMIYIGTVTEAESTINRQRWYFMKELAKSRNRFQIN